jgi:hypothetical protein
MPRYRCYLLDALDRIRHVEALDCSSDDQARARALELLRQHPTLQSINLWDGDRQVPAQVPPQVPPA